MSNFEPNNDNYNEIRDFFNEYFKLENEKYEINFLERVFSEYSNANGINNIVLSNYSDLRFANENIDYFARFFNHKYVYCIFKEIKKILIGNSLFVDLKYIDTIDFENNEEFKEKNSKAVNSLYIFSINKLIYKIFSKYNNNYKKFIEENNDYISFINRYENIINKFDFHSSLKINNNQNQLDFSINNIQRYLPYYFYDRRFNYSDYHKIYNFLQSYHDNLNDIEALISTKKINKKENLSLDKIKVEKVKIEKVKIEKVKVEKVKVEKVKKKSIPLTLKRNVWNKHIGEAIGKTLCLCCKLTEITQLNFSCGHIISEFNGGQLKLDNLKPICVSCNSSVGTKNMNEYIEEYGL